MSNNLTHVRNHPENTALILRARILGSDGSAVSQSDLSTITYSTFKPLSSTPTTAIVDGTSLTISEVVFNTMQSWDRDSTGYNFRAVIPGSQLGDIDQYAIEVAFTETGGAVYYATWIVQTRSVRTA